MRISWIKGAVALSTVVMLAGVSVPVGVSASVATQNQQTQSTKVSQKQVDQLNQQVGNLSASSIKKSVKKTSNAQLRKSAVKTTKQFKRTLTDPKISKSVKSVSLSDVENAATDNNLTQLKKLWRDKAASQTQNILTHSSGLSKAESALVQSTNLSQAVQQLTPAQVKSVLGQLSGSQWLAMEKYGLTTANQTIKDMKTPSATQVRQQTNKITAKQVTTAQQRVQAATDKVDGGYYTDVVSNPGQVAVKSNVATSLLGLLLPVISLAVKLTIGPIVGLTVGTFMYNLVGALMSGVLAFGLAVIAALPYIETAVVGLIPIFGPIILPIAAPFVFFIDTIGFLVVPILGGAAKVLGGGYVAVIYGAVAGVGASLLAPILPPVLTPPMTTLTRRLDQEITYADSLKSGHQYTQAINVKAGHSYRVSFKADQASNPETNDPITNFGSLTYGLVADKTAAIGKSDVSDIVDNVQNGSTTITSRAKTNYVMTFDAKQNGTIYLVADTADATIHAGIKQSQYATTPLWYVNTAVDVTLN